MRILIITDRICLSKFKENRVRFCRAVALEKIRRIFGIWKKRGGATTTRINESKKYVYDWYLTFVKNGRKFSKYEK